MGFLGWGQNYRFAHLYGPPLKLQQNKFFNFNIWKKTMFMRIYKIFPHETILGAKKNIKKKGWNRLTYQKTHFFFFLINIEIFKIIYIKTPLRIQFLKLFIHFFFTLLLKTSLVSSMEWPTMKLVGYDLPMQLEWRNKKSWHFFFFFFFLQLWLLVMPKHGNLIGIISFRSLSIETNTVGLYQCKITQ